MSNRDRLSKLADGWIEYSKATIIGRKRSTEEEERWQSLSWAGDAFWRLISRRPQVALEVIVEIMNRIDNEDVLGNLAASPLEDLLSENKPEITEAVESLAANDPKFRTLLKSVWRLGMNDETWTRVKLARG